MKPFESKMIFALCALMVITMAGCSSGSFGDYEVRPASNLPDRFTWEGSETTASEGGCRSPIIDPRDGTRGLIVRSIIGQGDYEVPPGRYGTSRGELLRIDCVSGVAIGIVKR